MLKRNEKWLELRSGDRHVIGESRQSEIFQVIARYKFGKNFCKDKFVLDAGCGTGFGTVLLSDVSKKVIGIDISAETIDYAKDNFPRSNLDFRTMDCRSLKFSDEEFDVVLSFEVIEHLPEHNLFLSEVKRVLKPSGFFICSSTCKNRIGRLV